MIIKFKKTHEKAFVPTKNNPTDSGFDLYADESAVIFPGETRVVKTGIKISLPEGYEAQVRPRSGISSKTSLLIMLGTIDNGYRGEIGVIVKHVGNNGPNFIEIGNRIAQLVPVKIDSFVMEEVDELDYTNRGSNGFGSSGT